MSDLYLPLKYAHILGAAVLFGTGLGIAFFMLAAHRTGDARFIAGTARTVVVADALFTATAVVLQPLTGTALAAAAGHSLTDSWIVLSLVLYAVTGAFWLPVVAIQMRLRRLAEAAAARGEALGPAYRRLFRIWFWSGFPAFGAVLAIYALMIWRPRLW